MTFRGNERKSTSQYDDSLCRKQTDARNNGTVINGTAVSYSYQSQTGRLDNVSDDTYSASYSYVAKNPLISQITFKQGTTPKMTTTKQYDKLNRLSAINSLPSGSSLPPASFAYEYNDANQRRLVSLADGSFWIYGDLPHRRRSKAVYGMGSRVTRTVRDGGAGVGAEGQPRPPAGAVPAVGAQRGAGLVANCLRDPVHLGAPSAGARGLGPDGTMAVATRPLGWRLVEVVRPVRRLKYPAVAQGIKRFWRRAAEDKIPGRLRTSAEGDMSIVDV